MRVLVVSLVLACPLLAQVPTQPPVIQPDQKLPVQQLDGEWTVTYAEVDGKKIDGKGFTKVTIRNNTVTCQHDGKEKTWKLAFGPHGMVRCTELTDGKTTQDLTHDKRDPKDRDYHSHHGVYIASQQYFCLCLNNGEDRRDTMTTTGKGQAQTGTVRHFGEQDPQGAHFVIILHRGGAALPGGK